jgi:hypothetical protein
LHRRKSFLAPGRPGNRAESAGRGWGC